MAWQPPSRKNWGLDLEKERLRYADYQERFGVQSEVR